MQNSKLQFKIKNFIKTPCITFNSQGGQALLIIVLVMVIALTVGLAIAAKSIFDVRISKEEQESKKAFRAAEAGIEQALKIDGANGLIISDQQLGNDAKIKSVTIESVDGSQFLLNGGNPVSQDEGIDIWLSKNDYSDPVSPSHFSIAWGFATEDSSGCSDTPPPAAMEIIVIYEPITNPTSKRFTYDPCSRGNSFTTPEIDTTNEIKGKIFPFYTKSQGNDSIDLSNGTNKALILRAIPLYANTQIAIKACASGGGGGSCTSLYSQGKTIESIGQSGETQRKIVTFKGFPRLPSEFFQYVLFIPQ